MLLKQQELDKAKKIFRLFEDNYKKLGNAAKYCEAEVAQNYETLLSIFGLE